MRDENGCKVKTDTQPCGDAPTNSKWVIGVYSRTWSPSGWMPGEVPSKQCVTSSVNAPECSFICDDDYVCNGNE